MNRKEAIATGSPTYTPKKPCKKCGEVALRITSTGKCTGCHPRSNMGLKSPRQAAIAAGRDWYTPIRPCTYCGTTALRHVQTGRCQGCATDAKRGAYNERTDAVISRAEARRQGLGVYRTGEPCKHGHRGHRYVSNCQCIECALLGITPGTDSG